MVARLPRLLLLGLLLLLRGRGVLGVRVVIGVPGVVVVLAVSDEVCGTGVSVGCGGDAQDSERTNS